MSAKGITKIRMLLTVISSKNNFNKSIVLACLYLTVNVCCSLVHRVAASRHNKMYISKKNKCKHY